MRTLKNCSLEKYMTTILKRARAYNVGDDVTVTIHGEKLSATISGHRGRHSLFVTYAQPYLRVMVAVHRSWFGLTQGGETSRTEWVDEELVHESLVEPLETA